MPRHLQTSPRAALYNLTAALALVAVALLGFSSGAIATNDNFSISTIGVEGQAYGTSNDACGYSGMLISIAASGEKNVNNNGNNAVVNNAYVQIQRYDSCQNVFIQEYGEADGISLSFAGGVNAGQVPKSATAAGQVPMQVTIYTATDVITTTDNLTFQLTLNQIGPVWQSSGNDQQSLSTGVSPSTTTTTFTDRYSTSNSPAAIASYSVSLAGNSVNPLPTLTAGILQNSKYHTRSINH
jgi:hypothetical protein